jgi:hypothetical protein
VDDIVLDFFAGSATTAHAVMLLNAEGCGKSSLIDSLRDSSVTFIVTHYLPVSGQMVAKRINPHAQFREK